MDLALLVVAGLAHLGLLWAHRGVACAVGCGCEGHGSLRTENVNLAYRDPESFERLPRQIGIPASATLPAIHSPESQ